MTALTTHGSADDPAGLGEQLRACERVVSVRYAIPGPSRFAAALARSWLSSYPVDLWKCRVLPNADVCVSNFLIATPNVPRRSRVPAVMLKHNVEYMIWKRLYDAETNPIRRSQLDLEWRKMRRVEARAGTKATAHGDGVGGGPGPAGGHRPSRRHPRRPHGRGHRVLSSNVATKNQATLAFTGAMDRYPNEDAIFPSSSRSFSRCGARCCAKR